MVKILRVCAEAISLREGFAITSMTLRKVQSSHFRSSSILRSCLQHVKRRYHRSKKAAEKNR